MEGMTVTLSELLRELCALIPLAITLEEDVPLETPDKLMDTEIHALIGDTVAAAARKRCLSYRASVAFGEWLAELCTGWSTRYSNEHDIMMLDEVFGRTAFGNPHEVVRIYMMPNWDALNEHLAAIQEGIEAAFNAAREMFPRPTQSKHA